MSISESLQNSTIAFFIPDWTDVDHPVIQSQVFGICDFVSGIGGKVLVIGCSEALDLASVTANERRGYDTFLMRPIFPKLGSIGMLMRCILAALLSQKYLKRDNISHVYVRSIWTALVAWIFFRRLNAVLVFDVRALVSLEVVGRFRTAKARVLEVLERISLMKADRLIAVSQQLKNLISTRYGRNDVQVVPSCVDISRFGSSKIARCAQRAKLGYSDDNIVLCFSGGPDHWQRLDDVIQLFSSLLSHDDSFRLLVLTSNPEAVRRKADDVNLTDSFVKALKLRPSEVPEYLEASDLAIVLRHDIALNHVASPIKVGEYLASGLPVIYSPWIGDLRNVFAGAQGSGFDFNDLDFDIDELVRFCRQSRSERSREEARVLAEKFFSRSQYTSVYAEVFRN